ncbi:hypothetical protein [Kiloniella antarctica]|uniref:Uncharacterized protein n=1 Tax=Kiloniella antarctica TaxID=1550907 RepID=A0ABW5BLG0_9PROT
MFKITFFLISMVNGQQEMTLDGSEIYVDFESCNAAAAFVAENSPAGYSTIWECKISSTIK